MLTCPNTHGVFEAEVRAIADGRKDSVPIVSAQFYRPDAGHPFNFEGAVPAH